MKYIRTRDGRIIKFDTSNTEEEIAGIKYDILGFNLKMTMQLYDLQKEDIIKVADHIETLCDEFVMIDEENDHIWRKKPLKDYKTYGAIWTEWGLKYVAFINNKGEFELL